MVCYSEVLNENESFVARELAALVASKVAGIHKYFELIFFFPSARFTTTLGLSNLP